MGEQNWREMYPSVAAMLDAEDAEVQAVAEELPAQTEVTVADNDEVFRVSERAPARTAPGGEIVVQLRRSGGIFRYAYADRVHKVAK